MITAYNMQYILSKVHDMDDKIMIQRILCRFIESQLKTMPRTIDQDANMKDRFTNLQKLMDKTENLDKEVCWEKGLSSKIILCFLGRINNYLTKEPCNITLHLMAGAI